MPGPQRKHNDFKVLEGSRGARKHPGDVFTPEAKAPICPSWLDKDAKREWARIVPLLNEHGMLSKIDRTALAVYCQAYAEFKHATKMLQSEGRVTTASTGYVQQHPYVVIQHKAIQTIKTFCTEFGLTPGARGRVMITKGRGNNDEGVRRLLD